MSEEELIPVEIVLRDMYADKGIVSMAARDYYRAYYATPEEKVWMDKEERMEQFEAAMMMGIQLLLLLYVIVAGMLYW